MRSLTLAVAVLSVSLLAPGALAQSKHANAVIDLWTAGKPAFGVFVPNENPAPRGGGGRPSTGSGRPERQVEGRGAGRSPAVYSRDGGEKLAMNPLYDFVFLNLEGRYDATAVKAIAEGLRSPNAVGRKTLIVRIPPIERDGAAAARARVKEALDFGADGITMPHIQNIDEARQAISFFQDAHANVWSPANPGGEKLAMMMIEDPEALAQAREIADLKGFSILACGIGSLAAALGGNREAAEAGTQKVLAETRRAKLVNMLTATAQDVEKRVKEGFLALLAQGQAADEAIRIGRAAAGR